MNEFTKQQLTVSKTILAPVDETQTIDATFGNITIANILCICVYDYNLVSLGNRCEVQFRALSNELGGVLNTN